MAATRTLANPIEPVTALEFFAGSGLVRVGLAPEFRTVWANDNCAKKRETYVANHAEEVFLLADIRRVKGRDVPHADLAWASFPCQDSILIERPWRR
jgi:DNA (cytosine-5)-methyltransferase 1